MSAHPRRLPTTRRTLIALGLLAALGAMLFAGVVTASTPVEAGFRDFQITSGGVARPTTDKPQSKLWYTDGTWFAGMFDSSSGSYKIYRLDETSHDWETGAGLPEIDDRNGSHGDYLWDEATDTLWVVSTYPSDDSVPLSDDSIRVYQFTYDPSGNDYTAAGTNPVVIPDTTSAEDNLGAGGSETVTVALDTSGRLWAVWPHSTEIRFSYSDDGVTWSTPAQVPSQAGNPIRDGGSSSSDTAAVFAFGSDIGILWSDHDDLPSSAVNGFYFTSIAAGDDPTVGTNWSTAELLPSLPNANDGERADNHLNVKVGSDGTVYAVGKTGKDTLNCATNLNRPLIPFFRRTTGGTWSAHLVSTVGDCNTRPQLVISEQLGVAYVLMTSPNGGEAIYLKSAPLSGPEAFHFRTADTTIQPGTPFIRSATETNIDDVSTTKQVVTSASGIVAIANNIAPEPRWYLHNEMAIGGSTDTTDPVGTVNINTGALVTADTAVSVAVPATDTGGSGVSLVRLANVATVDGDGILSDAGATTFAYTTPIDWTLTAGDGTKTVYVQWRDAAGNWSAVSSDTIDLDQTGPAGTVEINGGDATTALAAVSVAVPATDANVVANVRLSNDDTLDVDGVLVNGTTFAYATPVSWTLSSGNGTKTVYVQWQDSLGNWSGLESDSIVLDSPDTTFTAITPVRLLDTRPPPNGPNPVGIEPFEHDVPQTFQITGRGGIPGTAVAITGNLTVVGQQRAGYVTLGPDVSPGPAVTSTINFPLGDIRANGVFVPLNGLGQLEAVYRASSKPAGTTTHLVLDVTGYFEESPSEAEYFPVEPERFLDTRENNPAGAVKLSHGVPYGFQVGGRTVGTTTIPAEAVAITGNLTVTGQTHAGYLSLTTTSIAAPTTSTLNFPAGDTRANNVTMPLGAGGNIFVVYRSNGGTGGAHAILDVTGYFREGGGGLTYVPLTPDRIVDTRSDLGITDPLIAKSSKAFTLRGEGGIANDADAFTGNVTITAPTRAGYVSVVPEAPIGDPDTSTINFPVADTRANGLAGPIDDTSGGAHAYYGASSGTVQFIVDVTGYFH